MGSRRSPAVVTCMALALSACTIVRETQSARTATEQMLLSTAAERAADKMQLDFAHGAKAFVDPADFEGYDSKYALGAFKDRLLRRGALLVADKKDAEFVIAPRAGALSADENDFPLGIPSMTLPVPLGGPVTRPELALLKRERQQGVAKIAATAYYAKTGALMASIDPEYEYGYAHRRRWVVLLLISWGRADLVPGDQWDEDD